jgi:pantoate--beta-alanine ligase
MILIKKIEEVKKRVLSLKAKGKKIGFVPTMGALHDGHISLIQLSNQQCDVTICSIFINPSQFNNAGDFEKYPVTLDKDIYLLETNSTDILFLPSIEEIYPAGVKNHKPYPLGYIESILEGHYRPGHFQGVCQVVHILLGIIEPDFLYLGQKDYQQCLVVEKLVDLIQFPTKIIVGPTLREADGLAMSSRNLRLSEIARTKASAIHQELLYIKEVVSFKDIDIIKKEVTEHLSSAGFEKIDYVEIAEAKTLISLKKYNEEIKSVALIAAFLDGVRLIDNIALN